MKTLVIILLQISTGLFPACYSAKPSLFLKKFISEFRKEYKLQPDDVIALSTWSDSSHFYLDGTVVYGNEIVNKKDLVICEESADNFLYKSRRDKHDRRADKSIYYDDVTSFRLCFHNDRTLCMLYSYEISPMDGIPVLSRVEKKYPVKLKGLDPDCYNQFPGYMVEEPVKCENWMEVAKELNNEVYKQGIRYPYHRMVHIVITVNRYGEVVRIEIPRGTDDELLDNKILEICEPILYSQQYTPAKLRGYFVESNIATIVHLREN